MKHKKKDGFLEISAQQSHTRDKIPRKASVLRGRNASVSNQSARSVCLCRPRRPGWKADFGRFPLQAGSRPGGSWKQYRAGNNEGLPPRGEEAFLFSGYLTVGNDDETPLLPEKRPPPRNMLNMPKSPASLRPAGQKTMPFKNLRPDCSSTFPDGGQQERIFRVLDRPVVNPSLVLAHSRTVVNVRSGSARWF